MARELAVQPTSPAKRQSDADWDAGGDEINEELRLTWLALPMDEVRSRFRTVPGELRGYLTVVPESRWIKSPEYEAFFLAQMTDHYEAHAADLRPSWPLPADPDQVAGSLAELMVVVAGQIGRYRRGRRRHRRRRVPSRGASLRPDHEPGGVAPPFKLSAGSGRGRHPNAGHDALVARSGLSEPRPDRLDDHARDPATAWLESAWRAAGWKHRRGRAIWCWGVAG